MPIERGAHLYELEVDESSCRWEVKTAPDKGIEWIRRVEDCGRFTKTVTFYSEDKSVARVDRLGREGSLYLDMAIDIGPADYDLELDFMMRNVDRIISVES